MRGVSYLTPRSRTSVLFLTLALGIVLQSLTDLPWFYQVRTHILTRMGAKHAFLSLAYLVGAALLFTAVRAEFWKEKRPEPEQLEQHDSLPGFESSMI